MNLGRNQFELTLFLAQFLPEMAEDLDRSMSQFLAACTSEGKT